MYVSTWIEKVLDSWATASVAKITKYIQKRVFPNRQVGELAVSPTWLHSTASANGTY